MHLDVGYAHHKHVFSLPISPVRGYDADWGVPLARFGLIVFRLIAPSPSSSSIDSSCADACARKAVSPSCFGTMSIK